MKEINLINSLKDDLNDAKKVVFLTGAGVSTHSNIPDYRSKNGIYHGSSIRPEQILSEDTLYNHPEVFHDFVINNMYFPKAKPNLIHYKIAEICNKKGVLITQNVDTLDSKANNQHVIEFHGTLYNIYCSKCYKKFNYKQYLINYIHTDDNGIIRPGIVLYGESIDPQIINKSIKAIKEADLIIIVGTSFVVYPFAQLLTYKNTNRVWAINKTPIASTNSINIIQADALDIFKQL